MDDDDHNALMWLIQLFLAFMGALYVCIEILEWGWITAALTAPVLAFPVAIAVTLVLSGIIHILGRSIIWGYEHLDPETRGERRAKQELIREREAVQSTLRAAVAEDLDRHFSTRGLQSLEVTVMRREDGSLRISPRADQSLSDDDLSFVRELLVAKLPHLFGNALGRLMAAHHFAAMVLWPPAHT